MKITGLSLHCTNTKSSNTHPIANSLIRLHPQILRCDEIIKEVDKCTGEHKCQYYINQLEYLDENQRHPLIAEQKSLHCMGMLRNNKGSVSVFLILVLSLIASEFQQMVFLRT